jgi:phage tail-like protein
MPCSTYAINGKNRFYVTTMESGAEKWFSNVKTVGGISLDTEVHEWKSGDLDATVKLPGKIKYPAITLHKGFDNNFFISNWFNSIWSLETGSGSITAEGCRKIWIYVLRRNETVFRKIEVADAWPSKYGGDDLDGSSSDPWMEQTEISHSGWKFVAMDNPALTWAELGIPAMGDIALV